MNLKTTVRPGSFLLLYLFCGFYQSVAQTRNSFQPRKAVLRTIELALNESAEQYRTLMKNVPAGQLPRTFEKGKVLSVSPYGWVSGFYPGTLLYLYEHSKDSILMAEAFERMEHMEKLKTVTVNHDLGFMMYCSFGNAFRLLSNPRHRDILVESAKSLATRFYPKVGCIKSWDEVKSLSGDKILKFPVIIDNMMNLELLFFASKATGDPYYKNIAVTHAETTLKNHFRADFSSYHVVDYDPETGAVKHRETQQGFSHNSTWSRGQAWAIYGYTMVYRETQDKKFLDAAQKMADFYLDHPNLPKDKVPYWDFNVNQAGFNPPWKYKPDLYPEVPRDASAAAIVSSALIELAGYVSKKKSQEYQGMAEKMLMSLTSSRYRASSGTNGGFILMHASGGVPGNVEVDVPLSYADYYFAEALMRYKTAASKRYAEMRTLR